MSTVDLMDDNELQLDTFREAVEDLVETRGARVYGADYANKWPFGYYVVGCKELEALADLAGIPMGSDYDAMQFDKARPAVRLKRQRRVK